MMSKKNYEAFAKAMKDVEPPGKTGVKYRMWGYCVQAVAGVLKDDNPRFDAERFVAAVTKEDG